MSRHHSAAQPGGSQGRFREGSSQDDQRPSKVQRLEQALDETENNLLSAEERIQELERHLQEAQDENTQLKAGAAPVETEDNEQEVAAEEGEDTNKCSKTEAGRRCCLLHMLWMHDDCLFDTDMRNRFETIMSELEALRRSNREGDEDDEHGDDGNEGAGAGSDEEGQGQGNGNGDDDSEGNGDDDGKGKGGDGEDEDEDEEEEEDAQNGKGKEQEDDSDSSEVVDPVEEFWKDPPLGIASAVDVVREVVSHLDIRLARQWFEPWFMRQFKLGMRKMRSEAVNEVADQYHLVFQLTEDQFGERHGSKKRGAGAKKLLEDDAYLTEPLKDDKDTRSENERFLRSPTILRAIKLLLAGPSAIRNGGQQSAQAGPSRAHKWHIKSITPSIFSFACTIIHFVLSGDLTFDRVTPTNNYMKMYTDNFAIIRVFRRKNRMLYDELIELYNQEILPGLHPKDAEKGPLASMTPGRQAIFQRLVDQSSDEEEEEEGQANGEDKEQQEQREESDAEE